MVECFGCGLNECEGLHNLCSDCLELVADEQLKLDEAGVPLMYWSGYFYWCPEGCSAGCVYPTTRDLGGRVVWICSTCKTEWTTGELIQATTVNQLLGEDND